MDAESRENVDEGRTWTRERIDSRHGYEWFRHYNKYKK